MDGLVEGPLEERRVERDHRAHAAHRQARGERDRMLLGDADIDEPLRKDGLEPRQARPRRHTGGDGDDPPVIAGELDEL